MTKSEAVSTVKRANTRLKPVGDACYRIAQQRDIRLPQKEQKKSGSDHDFLPGLGSLRLVQVV